MTTSPLVSHPSPDSIIAWHDSGAITLRQFLADVDQLASRFPIGRHILNMCNNRYYFSVGLAAAIVSNKISLLPSTHTPEVIRQIKNFAPDVFCLTDDELCTIDLPQVTYSVMPITSNLAPFSIPQINSQQCIAIVFTSGSTGHPRPHTKTWGALVNSVQAEALRINLKYNSATSLIGTVSPQHMYGLESTVLIAWFTGNIVHYAQPFYPTDIGQILSHTPWPRVLVSSPLHLRTLLDAELHIPEITHVISATAPLTIQLAQDIESRCHAPLFEIYGSTETGLIATRRPTQSEFWQLLPEIGLTVKEGHVYAHGGHIETITIMNDVIESITPTQFLLHGRVDDMINIAGRRHSLASLNHILNNIPGVIDGAFYMPDETSDRHITTRLAACVVAPKLDTSQLLASLREHLAPVFLPRPLLFIDALPRNNTGKLSRAALHALFQEQNRGHQCE